MFVLRTIKDGMVCIYGKRYAPKGEYHGELDGQRWAFVRYGASWKPGGCEPFVSLWGTENEFRNGPTEYRAPNVIDGEVKWLWWYEVQEGEGDE